MKFKYSKEDIDCIVTDFVKFNATNNNNPSLSLQIPYFLLSFPCIYPLYPENALFQSSKLYGQSSSNVLNIYFSHERLVLIMREKKVHLYVDSQERSILLHSLVELKNQLIQQGRYTDCVDELIFKVVNAPVKRMKIEYV